MDKKGRMNKREEKEEQNTRERMSTTPRPIRFDAIKTPRPQDDRTPRIQQHTRIRV